MGYLIFNTEKEAIALLNDIDKEMGLPDGNGTDTWAVVEKAYYYNQDIWYFPCPLHITMPKEQKMVLNIDEFLEPEK